MATSILPLPRGSRPTNPGQKTRPSLKARKTDHSGSFVVTSRPLPQSDSGEVQGWTDVQVTPMPLDFQNNQARQNGSIKNGKKRADHGELSESQASEQSVKDTDHITLAYDSKGRRMVNQYVRHAEIGRGTHGRVWMCEELDRQTGQHVDWCAMKEVYREEQQRSLRKAQRAMHGPGSLGFGPAIQPPRQPNGRNSTEVQSDDQAVSSSRASLTSGPTTPTAATHMQSAFALSRELHKSSLAQHQSAADDTAFQLPTPMKSSIEPISIDDIPITLRDPDYTASSAWSSLQDERGMPRSQGRSGDIADMQKGLVADKDMIGGYGLAGLGRNTASNKPARNVLQMDDKVRQEIAIMKRCHHKNIVKLKEVINDPHSKKIFMVLEYMAGGQIRFSSAPIDGEPTMSVDESRQVFRDVLLGLEYLHYQGIIHRDIKPANLLWADKEQTCVKISDFGVSYLSEVLVQNEEDANLQTALRKTAGSPAFFAPELCYSNELLLTPEPQNGSPQSGRPRDMTNYFQSMHASRPSPQLSTSTRTVTTVSRPSEGARNHQKPIEAPPIGKAIDVWALGVTLYCLLFGTTPFMAETEYLLFNIIPYEEAPIPAEMGKERHQTDSEEGRLVIDLLGKLLEKDPLTRISLADAKRHPWVLRHLADPSGWLTQTDPAHAPAVTVTTEEVRAAAAERLLPADGRSGIRGSIKRAMTKFGNVVGVRSRRRSASSLSAVSSRIEEGPSRQGSGRSKGGSAQRTPPTPTLNEAPLSRKWSIKNRLSPGGGDKATLTSPQLTSAQPILVRSMSGSSAGESAYSPPLSQSMSRVDSDRLHTPNRRDAHLRISTGADPLRPRSALVLSPTSPDMDSDSKSSIRRVWQRFKSGTRTPQSKNGSFRGLAQDSPRIDISSATDSRSIISTEASAENSPLQSQNYENVASEVLDRADFDAFGRRRTDTSDVMQQDDFSDDSLSELEDEAQHGFTYNDGHGWQYSHGRAEDEQVLTSFRRPSNHDAAMYSGEDADAEHESDHNEDDEGLELNFSRRRRPTNPSDAGSPIYGHRHSRDTTPAGDGNSD